MKTNKERATALIIVTTGILMVIIFWITVTFSNRSVNTNNTVEEDELSSTVVTVTPIPTVTPTPVVETEVELPTHTFIFDNTIGELKNEEDYDIRPFELDECVKNCRYTFSNGFYVRDTYNLEVDNMTRFNITYKAKDDSFGVRVQEYDFNTNTIDELKRDYVEANGFTQHSEFGMPIIHIGEEWNEEHGLLCYADFYDGDYSINRTESEDGMLYCDEDLKLNYGIAKFFQYYSTRTNKYYSICFIKCTESGRILCIDVYGAENSKYPLAATIEIARDGVRLYK